MTTHHTKALLTIIALCLIWNNVTDTPLESVVLAQSATWEEQFQNWDENAQGSGLPNSNSALPDSGGKAYVCSSYLQLGGSPTMWPGDHGVLVVKFKTKPHCKGTTIGVGQFFSEGAAHPDGPVNNMYELSEAQLMAYTQMTQRAAAFGQEVYYIRCTVSAYTTNNYCLQGIQFREVD